MIKTFNNIILLMLWFSLISPAQVSSHHFDKFKHRDNISPSNLKLNTKNYKNLLKKNIFGYLPYWELSNANIRFDLLSHIAIFDFVLNSDGSLIPPYNWPDDWLSIINEAQSNDVKVILTVSNLSLTETDSNLVSSLINNQSNKNIFFDEVHDLISDYNLDGINIDFENLKLSERGDPINNFMQELRDSLSTWFIDKELSFATPAVNWGNRWKLKELSEICDYLFIMAYDYHGSWSTIAGPVAPLTGNNNYSPYNYVRTISTDYYNVDPIKIILGVPYYGAEWLVDTNDNYANVNPEGEPNSNWVGHVDYADVHYLFADYNYVKFDGISQTTYVLGPQGNKFKLIWMDTSPSLALKYDFAIENNFSGIGIWSLGKDGNRTELWDLIEQKFADTTTGVEAEDLTNNFILHQNYPNPFNPSTTIKFTVPSNVKRETSNTKLIVYDILGKEVATIINNKLLPGHHEVIFDATELSSGLYFYKLIIGNKHRATKKMLLLK